VPQVGVSDPFSVAGSATSYRYIGKEMERLDAFEKVTGMAKYVAIRKFPVCSTGNSFECHMPMHSF